MPIKEPDIGLEGYWEKYDLDGYNSDSSDDTVIKEEKEGIMKNREAFREAQREVREI